MSGGVITKGLIVSDLSVSFGTDCVLDGVTLEVGAAEIVGLIGASGCGKSTLAAACIGMLPSSATVEGWVSVDGDILSSAEDWKKARGRRIAMMHQDAGGALDPMMSIGRQIADRIDVHVGAISAEERECRVLVLLGQVGLGPSVAKAYPHRLSGGQKQRAALAMALAGAPSVLIADEPTSALDVVAQVEFIGLLRTLSVSRRIAVLLISHDRRLVDAVADRVVELRSGRLIDVASVRRIA